MRKLVALVFVLGACSADTGCGSNAPRAKAIGSAELECVADATARAAAKKAAGESSSQIRIELLWEELPCIVRGLEAKPAPAPEKGGASSGSGSGS